jgi:hypothetical protein
LRQKREAQIFKDVFLPRHSQPQEKLPARGISEQIATRDTFDACHRVSSSKKSRRFTGVNQTTERKEKRDVW